MSFSALQRAEIAEIFCHSLHDIIQNCGFSALQRAEIAEISTNETTQQRRCAGFSALQRAEIAEIATYTHITQVYECFSALQRAEIAEIIRACPIAEAVAVVSVLFNEPKLLKYQGIQERPETMPRFSALQRAEIAEMNRHTHHGRSRPTFQCSSTSRNC